MMDARQTEKTAHSSVKIYRTTGSPDVYKGRASGTTRRSAEGMHLWVRPTHPKWVLKIKI
jgi:hypothetical protein